MTKMIFFLILSIVNIAVASAQNFRGKISYANYYLDKTTMEPIAPTIKEEVLINDHFKKVVIQHEDSTSKGGLDWQIFDYKSGKQYVKEFYADARIVQNSICDGKKGAFSHEVLDTLIDFRGISVKIMIIMKENRKVGEFYFTDKIKISAAFYSCEDAGILNYFYRVSNGAFCLQQVHFGDLYTWIYQVQEMEEFDVPDKQFEVPKT